MVFRSYLSLKDDDKVRGNLKGIMPKRVLAQKSLLFQKFLFVLKQLLLDFEKK
jgi:hypothetical protein